MLAPIQQTLSLLESVCENKGLTIVLVREIYEDTAIGEEPRISERQIVDCIETDECF